MKTASEYRTEFSNKCTEVIEDGKNTVLYFKWYAYQECFKELIEAIRQEQRQSCMVAIERMRTHSRDYGDIENALASASAAVLQAGKDG